MRRFTLPFLILVAAVALVACGGGTTTTAGPSAAASQPAASEPAGSDAAAACAEAPAGATTTVEVEIKDFSYSPEPVTASVGDVIGWTNADSAPHTASLADGSCTTPSLNQGDTGALVFSAPGTYTYQCNVHPSQMKDFTIEVQ